MARLYASDPEAEFRRLRAAGRARLPTDPIRQRVDARALISRARLGSLPDDVYELEYRRSEGRELLMNRGFRGLSQRQLAHAGPDALDKINEMHRRRTAAGPVSGMGNATVAWPKLRDPFEQFREKAWWFLKEGEFSQSLSKIRQWCRLVYMTHPLVPSLIDIYSRFPIIGLEFRHKDQKLADWYNQLFLDELNYQEFLYDMAREFWLCGESFALGSWHDGIGAWDADELINQDDVVVSRNSVLRRYQFHLKVPEGIKKLIETRQPREEYEMLVKFYPYVLQWAQQNTEIPVSDVLLKQLKFNVNPWEPHGVPILMRAFKILMLEMSLEAAQDAVADRLYSPLILANLGIEDVGDGEGPWIPEPEEIDALRDDLALALMSDFRLMVYHHGLQIQSVFGREVMPRLDYDFERIDLKLMQIFGIGPELLQGGKASAPYASGALNRELITQMLTTHQVALKRFLRERMEVVAERQGHYEFEKRGSLRVPVYETVLMQDEETGEEYVMEKPKLAIPEPVFRSMNLRDETVERQFLLELKAAGVPVSDTALMVNIPIEWDDEVSRIQREKMDKVLAELEYQKRLFLAIFINHLPVPPAYAESYMEFVAGVQGIALAAPGSDITGGAPAPNLFPTVQESPEDRMQEEEVLAGPSTRSEESDEQRVGMPRRASISRPTIRKYATEEERKEYAEVGAEEWLRRRGIALRPVVEGSPVDSTPTGSVEFESFESSASVEPRLDISSQSEHSSSVDWVVSDRLSDEELEARKERMAGLKALSSPPHMTMRRKMRVPVGTKVKPATEDDLIAEMERLSALRGIDGEDANSNAPGERGSG